MIRLRNLSGLGSLTTRHGKQQIYTHDFFAAASASSSTYTATTTWQKAAIAAVSAVGALANPGRADLVAALGETTGAMAYQRMRQRMQVDPEGREVLRDRPRVTSSSVSDAWDMPAGTFGAAYAQFMGSRNFSADDRPPVRFLRDPELAFVAARAREVHDFWHVLFDLPTTVSGELLLKMVELVQTGLPMCGMSVVGGPLRLSSKQRELLQTVHYPWAAKAGLNAADLMCIYYEKHLEEDLEELRCKWRITPATLKVSKF